MPLSPRDTHKVWHNIRNVRQTDHPLWKLTEWSLLHGGFHIAWYSVLLNVLGASAFTLTSQWNNWASSFRPNWCWAPKRTKCQNLWGWDSRDGSSKLYTGDPNMKSKVRMTFWTLLVKISCIHQSLEIPLKNTQISCLPRSGWRSLICSFNKHWGCCPQTSSPVAQTAQVALCSCWGVGRGNGATQVLGSQTGISVNIASEGSLLE